MAYVLNRRRALQAFSAILGAVGCSSPEEERPPQETADLSFCLGGKDKNRSDAHGPSALHRYEKFVVLMMENRSFDHYFGHLSLPRSLGGEGRTDVDGFKDLEHSNPDLNGNRIKIWHARDMALGDIDHRWETCHAQVNGGRMDGFVNTHQEDLARLNDGDDATQAHCFGTKTDIHGGEAYCAKLADPMAFYKREDLPIYHALFDNFTLCDRWFCPVAGPTWPNRFYLHAATAGGKKTNESLNVWKTKTMWSILRKKCFSAMNFYGDVPFVAGAFPTSIGHIDVVGHGLNIARIFDNQPLAPLGKDILPEWVRSAVDTPTFQTLCREGKLPTVSVIDPAFLTAPVDDHPPHDIMAGQTFVSAIYKMLSESPDWHRTLFLITYDEHGSFYDHVAPPIVEAETDPDFKRQGIRVPTLVIGPYVKKSFVSKAQYDHVSFLSTITRRFDLEVINDRVRTANDLSDCIDRDALERPLSDPAILPQTKVSAGDALDSVLDNPGQPELAERALGAQATREHKKVHTDKFLEAVDKLGIVSVRR